MAGCSLCSTSGQAQKHWLKGHTGQQLHLETVKEVIGTYLFALIQWFSIFLRSHTSTEVMRV